MIGVKVVSWKIPCARGRDAAGCKNTINGGVSPYICMLSGKELAGVRKNEIMHIVRLEKSGDGRAGDVLVKITHDYYLFMILETVVEKVL